MNPVTPPRTSYAFTIWGLPHMVIRGYKHLDPGMQCQGYQFKEGETYTHKGPLVLCESGFHFCRHLEKLTDYKNLFKGSTHYVKCKGVTGDPRGKETCSEITPRITDHE